MRKSAINNPAKVFLVGAGPGDPRLITVRGAQCIAEADVVLYDYLVDRKLLANVAADTELICLGHHSIGRIMSQEIINARMIESSRQGKVVVRLKCGDPCVFGRSTEEIAALDDAGIAFEIVPGVTAGIAAGSCAQVPLTRAGNASAVAFVTGRQRGDDTLLDYAALASFPGTLVFYMGMKTADDWSASLLKHGKPPDTPVTIVRRCSWDDQETIGCTLATVGQVIQANRLRPPAVIIVGQTSPSFTKEDK